MKIQKQLKYGTFNQKPGSLPLRKFERHSALFLFTITQLSSSFSPADDAEVQRQKVVPVLMRDDHNFLSAHLDSPCSPPIRLFVCFVHRFPPSLLHWDTWDFLPQHNVEYCSYLSLRVELRGGREKDNLRIIKKKKEQINGVLFFMFMSVCPSPFKPLLPGKPVRPGPHLEILHSLLPKCLFLIGLGTVFKPRRTAEKKKRLVANLKKNKHNRLPKV